MTYPLNQQERRRSPRTSQSVLLLVRFRDSHFLNGETLSTIVVSHHGCVIMALHPFPRGTGLRLDTLQGHRTMTARVVHSDPIGTHAYITVWAIALELDQPGDVWMVHPPPPDSFVGCSGTTSPTEGGL
jgi:hypothetical protein